MGRRTTTHFRDCIAADSRSQALAALDLDRVIEIRPAARDDRFELDLGDCGRLLIPPSFDDEALGRLLLVLAAVR